MQKYSYSILVYTPDERRGERVNIGVVIYGESSVDIHLAQNLNKILALDPNSDLAKVRQLVDSLTNLPFDDISVSEMREFLSNIPAVSASDFGWFEASDSQPFDFWVKTILDDIVVVPRKKVRRNRVGGRLNVSLKTQFKKSGILGSDESDIDKHLVVPQYPISESSGLYADFALKNGVLHLTETIDFRVSDASLRNEKFKLSALKAITLEDAKNNFGNQIISNVVFFANAKTEKNIHTHLDLLSRHSDHIYNYASKDEAATYMEYILSAANQEQTVAKH